MADRLLRFKERLIEKRYFRVAWLAKDSQIESATESSLSELPDDIAKALVATIDKLPIHPREQEVVLDALNEAIAQWRSRPHVAVNSMVLLGHPVSAVSRIVIDSLEQLETQAEEPQPINLLDWLERPPDMSSIQAQIEQTLVDRKKPGAAADESADELTAQNLAVIPNLCWCFLRSAEGLDGVDYLRDSLLSDRTQFWIIGSGQVGWEYLKATLKFHAYCGDTVSLPKLSGEELQDWLDPIVEQFEIRFQETALHKRFRDPESLKDLNISFNKPIESLSEIAREIGAAVRSSLRTVKGEILSDDAEAEKASPKRDYFDRLADLSNGVSIVALQLFIKSIRYQEPEDSEENAKDDAAKPKALASKKRQYDSPSDKSQKQVSADLDSNQTAPQKPQLIAAAPKLPTLPNFDQSDLYLLYSIMLHDDLTIKALAASLGDAPQVVNNQVQILRNAGIIEQEETVIKINPVHYPQLQRELAKNNFMIEVP